MGNSVFTAVYKIPHYADLLSGLYLQFEMAPTVGNIAYYPNGWDSVWGDYYLYSGMMYSVMKRAELRIGGQKIDEIYPEWCQERLLTHTNYGIGTKPPAGYIKPNNSFLANCLTPEFGSNEVLLPLPFWFERNEGSSIPLISLYNHEVEVIIEFNNIQSVRQSLVGVGKSGADNYPRCRIAVATRKADSPGTTDLGDQKTGHAEYVYSIEEEQLVI